MTPLPTLPSPSPAAAGPPPWVPIRSLTRRHRQRIVAHLLALPAGDRYLRFGYAASDEQIGRYVLGIDFARDEVFGIFNRRLELIALAHLAYEPPQRASERPAMAEFGVSVLTAARGRGYGARLFERAVMHARNRGIDRLFIHALSENVAMLKIARAAGATVQREGSESEAWLQLPPDSFASRMEEIIETHAAEVDYQFKRHVLRFEQLLEAVREVRAHLSLSGHSSLE